MKRFEEQRLVRQMTKWQTTWKGLVGAGITLFIWWLFASGKLVLVPRDPLAPFRATVEQNFDEIPRRAGDRPYGPVRWVDKGAPVGMSRAFLTDLSGGEVQTHYRSLLTQDGWLPDAKVGRRGEFRSHAKYCKDGYSFSVSTERHENSVLYTIRMFWTRDHKDDDYCPKSGSLAKNRNQ